MDFSSGCNIKLVASFLNSLEVPEDIVSGAECPADQRSSISEPEDRTGLTNSVEHGKKKEYPKIRENQQIPTYEIIHRQFVNPEDIYLRVCDKDPGSQCNDETEITIFLPETTLADISIDVTKDGLLTCETTKYFLQLIVSNGPLNSSCSKAKWDPDCNKLAVTVPKQK